MKTPYDFYTDYTSEEATKDNLRGTCPFCKKEDHFFYHSETFQWDCKRCGLNGNAYTFIALIHEKVCIDSGHPDKGLPAYVYKQNGVRFNPLINNFVIPTYNNTGVMNNLYKYVTANNTIYGGPSFSACLFNDERSAEQIVWVCEGHWDKMAAEAIFGTAHSATAIGLPGANSFKKPWVAPLRDRDVVLCLHNDEAGKNGTDKILDILKDSPQKPRSVAVIRWPEDAKKGFDLRDAYLEHGVKTYSVIKDWIVPIEERGIIKVTSDSVIEDFSCDSYDKALTAFQTAFHTTEDMKATLALVMASIWSIKLDDMEQLWLKIIGPPGSGKTRIAKAVSASDQVESKSTFTGLFSGWKDVNDDSDAGLIPLISGKTLIVKDADALLRQANVEQIFSELRDFYDKDSSVTYRNRVSHDYRNIKSTIIICGTQQLRSADHAFLGERFMAMELNVSDADKKTINQKVLQRNIDVAMGRLKAPEQNIMACMKGWINHLMSRDLDSEIPEDMQHIFVELANLVALMRTTVDRDRRRKITTPAVAEMPGRIIGQTITAAFALCVVLGINRANAAVYQIITKMLRDTINPRSDRYKICQALIQDPNITTKDLIDHCQLNQRTVDDEIDDMRELGIIEVKKTVAGQNSWRYKFILHEDIRIGLTELGQ